MKNCVFSNPIVNKNCLQYRNPFHLVNIFFRQITAIDTDSLRKKIQKHITVKKVSRTESICRSFSRPIFASPNTACFAFL